MLDIEIFTKIAYSAVAILIAVLAVYLAVRLIGKLAKFILIAIAVAAVLWLLFSQRAFLGGLLSFFGGLDAAAEKALAVLNGALQNAA